MNDHCDDEQDQQESNILGQLAVIPSLWVSLYRVLRVRVQLWLLGRRLAWRQRTETEPQVQLPARTVRRIDSTSDVLLDAGIDASADDWPLGEDCQPAGRQHTIEEIDCDHELRVEEFKTEAVSTLHESSTDSPVDPINNDE